MHQSKHQLQPQPQPQAQTQTRSGLPVRSQIRAGYTIEITIPDGLSVQTQAVAPVAAAPAASVAPAATA